MPDLPGVAQPDSGEDNTDAKQKVILGFVVDDAEPDANFPYVYLGNPDFEEKFGFAGFAYEFVQGMNEVCDVEVVVQKTDISACEANNTIGNGLASGHFHGCLFQLHSYERDLYADFTKPIINDQLALGVLTRLDAQGQPVISPSSDLKDVPMYVDDFYFLSLIHI